MVEPSLPSEGATAAASPALPRRLRARHKPFSARGNSSAFRRSFFVSVSARFEAVSLLRFRLELVRFRGWGTRVLFVSAFVYFETVSLLSFRLELVRFRDWDTGVFEIGLLPSGPIRSRFRGGASAALARGRTECRVRVTTLFKAITFFPRVLIFVFSFTRGRSASGVFLRPLNSVFNPSRADNARIWPVTQPSLSFVRWRCFRYSFHSCSHRVPTPTSGGSKLPDRLGETRLQAVPLELLARSQCSS